MKLIIIYLLIMNVLGCGLMHIDKICARKKLWRIPEATLLEIAALGGSIGTLIGMYTFRHKTRHRKFTIGLPCILAVQIALALILIRIV